MKQYRLQPGTSSRIYYLLTVKDDGTMALEFHGTDRTLTEEASVNQGGWIVTKGAMYPPIDHPNGRWQLMDDVVVADASQNPSKSETKSEECSTFVPQEVTTTDCTDDTDSYSEPVESETTNFTNFANNREQSSLLELPSESKINEVNDTNNDTEQNDAPEYSEPAKSRSSESKDEPAQALPSRDVIRPTVKSESAPEPKQLDLFAQMQMEVDRLREENERLRQCNMTQSNRGGDAEHAVDSPSVNAMLSQQGQSPCVPKPRRAVRAQKPTPSPYERLYGAPAITVNHTDDHSDRNRKIFAAVATAVVFIVLVNTIGLFGIAALGLLAGGVIK